MIDNINVVPIDNDTIRYHGYFIKRNGSVTDLKGKEISKYNLHYPYSHITLKINNKLYKKNVARLIYSLFYELDTGMIISNSETLLFFKDNNSQNVAFDNLEVVSKKEGFRRTGKYTKQNKDTGSFIPRFTYAEAEEIRKKYITNANKNNRNQFVKTSPSIRDLAREYNCSTTLISKIIKGEYKA